MTLIELPEIEQGTEAWFDQRRGLVTASVVGKLVTAKTMRPADNDTSRDLTDLLVSERIAGWTEPTFVNFDMQRGVDDEPRARDTYAEYFGVTVRETGFMLREEATWKLGYSPDGLVGADGLIEIKSRKPKKQVRTVLDGDVPAENMAQIQAGLLVKGRDWLDYVSYAGGLHMYVKRVYPDHRWFTAIVAAVEKFEKAAEEMVAKYESSVIGLPTTERILIDNLGLVF